MHERYDWELDDPVAIAPELYEQDNPVTAVFLGLDGEPLIEIRDHRTVPFGYQK